MSRSTFTITKDESAILVAIGKLETKVDGLTEDVVAARQEIKDINTGFSARLLNLESNAVSKFQYDQLAERVVALEDNNIALTATLKVWLLLGGGVWSVVLVVISVLLAVHFHTN